MTQAFITTALAVCLLLTATVKPTDGWTLTHWQRTSPQVRKGPATCLGSRFGPLTESMRNNIRITILLPPLSPHLFAADLSTTNRNNLQPFFNVVDQAARPVTVVSFGDSALQGLAGCVLRKVSSKGLGAVLRHRFEPAANVHLQANAFHICAHSLHTNIQAVADLFAQCGLRAEERRSQRGELEL